MNIEQIAEKLEAAGCDIATSGNKVYIRKTPNGIEGQSTRVGIKWTAVHEYTNPNETTFANGYEVLFSENPKSLRESDIQLYQALGKTKDYELTVCLVAYRSIWAERGDVLWPVLGSIVGGWHVDQEPVDEYVNELLKKLVGGRQISFSRIPV